MGVFCHPGNLALILGGMMGAIRVVALVGAGLWTAMAAAQPVFTGDVFADFDPDESIVIVDPGGVDVGVPQAAAGTVSGWDLRSVRLFYDVATDTLYVGFDTYGIAGDADGDGDPGAAGPVLAELGGQDAPDLGGTESFALLLDFEQDGAWDVIAGVPAGADLSGFMVSHFVGDAVVPAVGFGMALAQHEGVVFASPSAEAPDLEFTIVGFSVLAKGELSFAVNAFMGSLDDAGYGEDFAPGVGQAVQVCFGEEACDDGDPCTTDGCSALVGCVYSPANGAECDDGDVCTLNDQCFGTVCAPSGLLNCDDGNECTLDSCDPAVGCVHIGEDEVPADAPAHCEGVPAVGWCDGHALVRCDEGEVVAVNCLDFDRACGWDEALLDGEGAFGCVEQHVVCDDIPDSGHCEGDVLSWCDTATGLVDSWDCAENGESCGWTGSFFCCHPPEQCVPICHGKDCGDDGCGGTCGECPDSDVCSESGLCIPCAAATSSQSDPLMQQPPPPPIGEPEGAPLGIIGLQYQDKLFPGRPPPAAGCTADPVATPTAWWLLLLLVRRRAPTARRGPRRRRP